MTFCWGSRSSSSAISRLALDGNAVEIPTRRATILQFASHSRSPTCRARHQPMPAAKVIPSLRPRPIDGAPGSMSVHAAGPSAPSKRPSRHGILWLRDVEPQWLATGILPMSADDRLVSGRSPVSTRSPGRADGGSPPLHHRLTAAQRRAQSRKACRYGLISRGQRTLRHHPNPDPDSRIAFGAHRRADAFGPRPVFAGGHSRAKILV